MAPNPAAPAVPHEVSAVNSANALTLLRLLMVPAFVVLLFVDGGQNAWWRLGALTVFLLAAVTDRVDGELARRRGLITDFGKIADPIADKALTGAALVSLSVLGELAWWMTCAILLRELGVTVLRFVVIRQGVMPASRGGKAKTVLQIVAIAAYLLPYDVLPFAGIIGLAALAIMSAAVAVTVATGLDYVVRAVRLRRTAAQPSGEPASRRSPG